MLRITLRLALIALIGFLPLPRVFAIGGTMIVASKGEPVHVSANWPEGVEELLDDATRTTGWNSFFSEWPNDVNQYGFEVTSTDDVNRLIEKLAAVKCELRQIRLSYLKEPASLGWVTNLPEGNNTAVIFSIGDQARIDQWYQRVRKPFGVMEFLAAPVAVPPTLTIFVQNDAVDLEALRIPDGIIVESGYVPTVFHRFNTKHERDQTEAKAKATLAQPNVELDSSSQEVLERIEAYINKRTESDRTE